MKYFITLLLCFAVTSLTYSQLLTEQWAARYNGTANNIDMTTGLAVDNQGGVVVTGFGYNTGTGRDYITVKYNPDGTTAWVKTYNGETNGGDYSLALALDGQNNVYVTGRSDRGGPTFSDITTIKYNPNGVVQWVAYYNNSSANLLDEACCIKVDGSGNVYVAGRSEGGSATNEDMIIVKYDNSGTQIWAQRYDGTAHNVDRASSIDVDAQGNVFVCGTALNTGAGSDYVLVKYNSTGVEQWVKNYNGNANGGDQANVVKVDPAGNAYITGFVDNAASSYDFFTVKVNPDGVTQWTATYNGQGNLGDFPTAMTIDNSGNVYVTGKSTGTAFINDSNYATIKYNSQGVQQWVAIYKNSNSSVDVARSIVLDDLGNVYVTGGSTSSTMNDYTTIKYKNSGVQEWVLKYNGPSNNDDFSNVVTVDANHNVYVTGRSYAAATNFDFVTVKYSIPAGITHNGNKIPDRFSLEQNYPNPFNPNTVISFSLPKESTVKLTIFDMSGREVSELINSTLTAGNYKINFDGNGVSSGIYFYRLNAGEFTATKKMILIK